MHDTDPASYPEHYGARRPLASRALGGFINRLVVEPVVHALGYLDTTGAFDLDREWCAAIQRAGNDPEIFWTDGRPEPHKSLL